MDLYGIDMEIGNIRLSDYNLILASFDSNGLTEGDLGMDFETNEEYIGNHSVPTYLGANYTSKLKITATLVRNPCCAAYGNGEIPLQTCRAILKNLTGRKFYQKMILYKQDYDEPIHFRVRCVSASYKKMGDTVVGIILELECDSQYAWTEERTRSISFKAGEENIVINHSDSLDEYLLPKVQIFSTEPIEELRIINVTDNGRETILKNISKMEYIQMDSARSMLSTSIKGKNILNDFNFIFIRLLNGENRYKTNHNVDISFTFSEPRKVGLR